MKYISKDKTKIVEVTKNDGEFVWFKTDGIEVIVRKSRFLKTFEELRDE